MKRKLNIQLLRKLRTRFVRMRHTEHFNMQTIASRTECGTVMCIAGHALDLAGYKMRARRGEYDGMQDFDFFSPNGRKVAGSVLAAAARELGMPYSPQQGNKAFDLFHDWELVSPKQAAERISELITTESS